MFVITEKVSVHKLDLGDRIIYQRGKEGDWRKHTKAH